VIFIPCKPCNVIHQARNTHSYTCKTHTRNTHKHNTQHTTCTQRDELQRSWCTIKRVVETCVRVYVYIYVFMRVCVQCACLYVCVFVCVCVWAVHIMCLCMGPRPVTSRRNCSREASETGRTSCWSYQSAYTHTDMHTTTHTRTRTHTHTHTHHTHTHTHTHTLTGRMSCIYVKMAIQCARQL
jgi:hypothetical protein